QLVYLPALHGARDLRDSLIARREWNPPTAFRQVNRRHDGFNDFPALGVPAGCQLGGGYFLAYLYAVEGNLIDHSALRAKGLRLEQQAGLGVGAQAIAIAMAVFGQELDDGAFSPRNTA